MKKSTNMKKPKISICIPTFNRAQLLSVTLQCIVDQTVQPDEVIVIDNASTDNTADIVASFKKSGIDYIRNNKNIGMAGNYNRCVELATNEFFTILPSDDLIAPNWYKQWINVISKHKADLYTSPLTIVNNNYKPIWAFLVFPKSCMVKQPFVHRRFCERYTPGLPPSAASIYRKSVFARIAPFRSREGTECDVRPGIALFDMCDVYYYDRRLFAFREHPMRSFDKKQEKKTNKRLEKIDHYFSILKDENNKKDRGRSFVTTAIFMSLCNVNLYIVYLDFSTIIGAYKSALKNFPDLFRRFSDWKKFISIQLLFIKRGLFMYRVSRFEKAKLKWIEDIRKREKV